MARIPAPLMTWKVGPLFFSQTAKDLRLAADVERHQSFDRQVAASEAESVHPRRLQSSGLGGAIPDALILHEHCPSATSRFREPGLVRDALVVGLSVVLRERDHLPPRTPQSRRHPPPPQRTIDEEDGHDGPGL